MANKTKSLFIPITLHMALDASFEFDMGWQSVAVCVPIWIFLYLRWIKTKNILIPT